ncbi:hypothetical protein KK062_29435 [Fulvivirgaceae bacterium PWU5]|uniref:Arginine decarboxylase helical bundle domain-containing protein n=1 Tax=Dawidia cretensis TaxID=2782350 RepID=A0AAP2E3H9_9BACT|nr:hypothetical protein [Dawidia cretensis]
MRRNFTHGLIRLRQRSLAENLILCMIKC